MEVVELHWLRRYALIAMIVRTPACAATDRDASASDKQTVASTGKRCHISCT